jgi:hypothetical protein
MLSHKHRDIHKGYSHKHDAWCKNMDDLCAARGSGNKPSNKAPSPDAAAPPQSLPSTTSFVTLFVLEPDFQLRQLIASGRMHRVLCRSRSQVKLHKSISITLLPFITLNSNDLTFTQNILFHIQDPCYHDEHCRLCPQIF